MRGDADAPGFAVIIMSISFDLVRSEEHTSELRSLTNLVCRLLRPSSSPLFPYTTLFRSSHGGRGGLPLSIRPRAWLTVDLDVAHSRSRPDIASPTPCKGHAGRRRCAGFRCHHHVDKFRSC